MKFALSTLAQLTTTYIALPASLANTSASAWEMGGEFIVHDLSTNVQLLGANNSTQTALRLFPDGSLAMRSNSENRITSAPGSIVVDVPFKWKIKNNVETGCWELYLHDLVTPVGVFARDSANWAINQLARYHTSSCSLVTVLSFYSAGSASYIEEWDDTTATGNGTTWLGKSGTRSLTLMNPGSSTDSWWVPYGSQPEAHVGGALLTIPADVITGGVFAQSQHVTGGALLTIPADVIAGGVFSETQHVTSGALLTLSADFIAGGVFAQTQHVTGGALLTIPADVITGGVFAQSQSFTSGALLTIPADVITGGTFAQSQNFTSGALLTIPADFIATGFDTQRQYVTGGALLTVNTDFITGGFITQGDHHSSGALLTIAADFIAGGVFAQSQHVTAGALLAVGADFIAGGFLAQGDHHSSGALLTLSADFIAGGVFAQSQHVTGGALLTIPADVITGGSMSQGDHHVSGALLTVPADFIATGSFTQMEGFVGGGLLMAPADFIVDGDIQYNPNVVGGALLHVACDFIVDGQYNQQYNYEGGAILECNARFIAGGEFYQAIQKLRHSGHRVWNEQARQDQIQYVRQHPDNFTALLYLPAEPEAPVEVDEWLDTPLFGRVDANQKATGYEDPKVCWVFERPREGAPFVVDADGGDLVNEHEDYLTICAEMDLPVGAALEFEEELTTEGDTRRSWWYVHHITSYGTTKAGSVYYLIPLRDFTGLNA